MSFAKFLERSRKILLDTMSPFLLKIVVFRLRRSGIIACAIMVLKPMALVVFYSPKTREANTTRRTPNITALQYHSPKANKTAQHPEKEVGQYFY